MGVSPDAAPDGDARTSAPSSLRTRLLLGPLLIAAMIGVVWLDEWLGNNWARLKGVVLTPVLGVAGVVAGWELARIVRSRGIQCHTVVTCLAVLLGLLISGVTQTDLGRVSGVAIVCTAATLVLGGAAVFYSRKHTAEGVVAAVSCTLLGFVYIGLMGGFILALRKEFTGWLVLAVLLVVKSYDIGAYFSGRFFGRTKLIPWLSPRKTVEGLIGGAIVSTLCGLGLAWVTQNTSLQPRLPLAAGAVGGAVLGLLGQLGDLLASLLKRDAGMKDASAAVPGFGGVLDVIDSPLLVAPVAYWLLIVAQQA